MSEKVKLPKEVAEAIELMKNRVEIIDDQSAVLFLVRKNGGDFIKTLVDIEDIPKIADTERKWCSLWKKDIGNFYVKSTLTKGEKDKILYLHRVIMDAPHGKQVDHINRNTLDNRKANLRIVTASENQWNKGSCKHGSTGIKNINWDSKTKMFTVKFYRHKKHHWIGRFSDITEAQNALNNYLKGVNA